MTDTINLTYKVYTSFDELSNIQEEWDSFLLEVKGDIYLTFNWCKVWWQYYGKDRDLKIYFIYDDKKMVGIMPIFIEKLILFPMWLRVAKVVGSDFTVSMVNPPVKPDHIATIFKLLATDLLYKYKCDALWISPVSAIHDSVSALCSSPTLFSNSLICFSKHRKTYYTMFNLPDSFEKYLQTLEKRQRGNFKRDSNLFQKSFNIQMDVMSSTEAFDAFQQLHELQWQAEGKLGHFKDWPYGYEFNKTQADIQAQLGRFRLVRLKANDKVVSYQLCYVFGDTLYWRLPARCAGAEWDRFGLGRLGLIKMIQWAIEEGYKTIEAGAGHYDYKVKSGGIEYDLVSIMMSKNSYLNRLRLRMFLFLSKVLNALYYGKWFFHIAPKLPIKRKPLWKLWIKTRI